MISSKEPIVFYLNVVIEWNFLLGYVNHLVVIIVLNVKDSKF